ncbi:hypothetical protein EVAR_87380_1 [Eumeta japonica]|uniref:Uncharacterized protein n=1 Tax=Eumeta variegata TaxID=151549 RepID=A0A4C1Y0R7_EUMVA|nr:hypothetical protein EVAR_87380_1 [Eumeta japonica]
MAIRNNFAVALQSPVPGPPPAAPVARGCPATVIYFPSAKLHEEIYILSQTRSNILFKEMTSSSVVNSVAPDTETAPVRSIST